MSLINYLKKESEPSLAKKGSQGSQGSRPMDVDGMESVKDVKDVNLLAQPEPEGSQESKTETNIQPPKETDDWDGKDYRGKSCCPSYIQFLKQHPLILDWIRRARRPYGSIQHIVLAFKEFIEYTQITPAKLLMLNERDARNLIWDFIEHIGIDSSQATIFKGDLSTFYLFHNEKRLEFIRGKHDIKYESSKVKERMSKDVVWRIIGKTRNLHDETLLTFTYECGLRRNAISHLTYGHYKKFMWFKKTETGVWIPTTENEGEIAIFRVVAKANKDYTHDDKLSGKGLNWYYGLIHKEATKLMKEYLAKFHQNSDDSTRFWQVNASEFWSIAKVASKRANLDTEKITFHGLRRGFSSVIRNTSGITDPDFKEALMGHVLSGSRENYFDKDPTEFVREYAKCDFSPSAEIVAEKQREIDELKAKLEAALKTKEESPTPIIELPKEAPTPIPNSEETPSQEPSPDDWVSQYQKDMQQPKEPKTPKCAKGFNYLESSQCDRCEHNKYCDYSTANKHFISHEAI